MLSSSTLLRQMGIVVGHGLSYDIALPPLHDCAPSQRTASGRRVPVAEDHACCYLYRRRDRGHRRLLFGNGYQSGSLDSQRHHQGLCLRWFWRYGGQRSAEQRPQYNQCSQGCLVNKSRVHHLPMLYTVSVYINTSGLGCYHNRASRTSTLAQSLNHLSAFPPSV